MIVSNLCIYVCTKNRTDLFCRCYQHGTARGIRVGSFFEGSNLDNAKIIGLLHYWSFNIPVTTTAALLGIDEKQVITWHKVRISYVIRRLRSLQPLIHPSSCTPRVGDATLLLEMRLYIVYLPVHPSFQASGHCHIDGCHHTMS